MLRVVEMSTADREIVERLARVDAASQGGAGQAVVAVG
jgi:hypothetical protein